MLQSPIEHSSTDTVFSDYDGWSLPVHYGDVTAEYQAARSSVGISDLSHRGKLRMTGKDRQSFLHRIVTNDINGLDVGQSTYACMLTPQGKIIADMTVYLRDDDILFDLEPGMTPTLIETMDRYAIIDDVAMADVTAEYGLIGVHGPGIAALLQTLIGDFEGLEPSRHMSVDLQGVPLCITRAYRTGGQDYDLHLPVPHVSGIWQALKNVGTASDTICIGAETLEILRVEAGIPRYGAELDDRIIPNEAVKERAVSFNKGCYIGQEPVVMMEHRGRPNRLLAGLKMGGLHLPARNTILKKDDQEAGWITSAVHSQMDSGVIAIGFVRRKYLKIGDHLTVEMEGTPYEAEIVDLPFYKSGLS